MAKNNKEQSSSPGDVSILSSGIRIEGNIFSEGNIRIDGKVEGNVSTSGNLTLGENSDIKGEIKAKNITINGKVEGKLDSTEKLILEANSSVSGDISCKILVIQSGAQFNGNSHMGEEIKPVSQPTPVAPKIQQSHYS